MVVALPRGLLDTCPLIRERTVHVGGYRVNFLEAGFPDRPALVLAHGFGAWARGVWTATIAELGHHFHVFAPDLLGFGRSDKPGTEFYDARDPYGHGVRHFARFLDEVGVPDAHVVGNSLGGLMALRLALDWPRRVRSLTLVSSLGLGRDIHHRYKLLTVPGLRHLFWRPSRGAVRQLWRGIVHDPAVVTDALVDENLRMAMEPGADRIFRSANLGVGFSGQRFVYVDRLHELAMPTLIVWGKDDPVFPVAHGIQAANEVPGSRLEVFDRCGHVPPIETPSRFNHVLLAFLTDVEAARTRAASLPEGKGLSGATG